MADPGADLNVVAVGGGLVALHGPDDGSVGEEPNVDLADVQLVVGEEFVPVNPLAACRAGTPSGRWTGTPGR